LVLYSFDPGRTEILRLKLVQDPSRTAGLAHLRLAAGAVVVSLAPVFVRLTGVTPVASAFYRTLFAGAMLVVLVKLRRERLFAGRAALVALVAAGTFFAFDLWTWHASIWIVGPGLATLLANFQVFFLALAGIVLYGERFRWQLGVAIPLAFAGLYLIVGLDWSALGPRYPLGIGLGLGCAVLYAGYLLSLRRARTRGRGASTAGDLAIVSLISAAVLGAGAPLAGDSLAIPTPADLGLLVGYALVAQVVGWLLISSSLAHVPASTVGLTLLLQPSLAYVWDVLFFGQPFGPRQAIGAAETLAAIWVGSRRSR
jgi:drug/metabolite transporter (DMT)-like permease